MVPTFYCEVFFANLFVHSSSITIRGGMLRGCDGQFRLGQEFVDDLAMTSMARLWDVGKSEPIKAGSQRA